MESFYAIIIGFGKGGKTLATYLAKNGKKVALIEKSPLMYGGTCINIGCIPTKTLIHSAKLASEKDFLAWEEKKKFYREAIDNKNKITSFLRDKNYHNVADNDNVTIFNGHGSFVSENKVKVTDTKGQELIIQAEYIFINTGSQSIIPNIKGVESENIYTSTSLLELNNLPDTLIIVGGGYIGLEFASMYASFGSKVTVLEGGDKLISREDRDIADAVMASLQAKGVSFEMNVKVTSFETKDIPNDGTREVRVNFTQQGKELSLKADAVLLATGRKPATENLNLQAAGVEIDDRGAIKVNEYLQSTNNRIFALGDVKGGAQFTYISLDDYRIVVDYLFNTKKRKMQDRQDIVYSVFIDPPLSRIGLSELDAKNMGLNYKVKTLAVSAIPRARTIGQTDGLMKAIIDNNDGKILGCTLFCAESSEIINIVALAVKSGLSADVLRNFIFTHPSMSEAFNDLFLI